MIRRLRSSFALLIFRRARARPGCSGEPFFASNQGVWRLTSRVDGAPFVSGPITLADGSQVGPFAYLA
jgi:hypothetical protein